MADCVFCNLAKNKIIFTDHNINVLPTLGQITDGGYVLLIPSAHIPCLGDLKEYETFFFDRLIKKTSTFLKREYQSPVTIFEHGIVGQTVKHAHLHLLPADIDLTKRVTSDFPESKLDVIENLDQLRILYQSHQEPYLLWSTTDGKYLVCWNPSAPAQYLRTVTADLLGRPERANWKEMDPKLDQLLIEETIENLVPHFLTSLF